MTRMDKRIEPVGHQAERLLVLEFNELCPALLDRWMAEGVLPNFRKLYEQCDVFVTNADVETPTTLEPWIQWYSIHSGLSYEQHRVFHLTEGPRAGHDDIFQILLRAQRTVASFASMNLAPFAAPGSAFVSDPWSENGDAFPAELNRYNRFVSHNVREYSNAAGGLGLGDYAKFLAFMAGHGLSAATVAQIIAQLASERLKDRKLGYKRVALLDRMQFDVFRDYYRRLQPDFATFFLNSTAHLQHSYWRHMEPEAFTVRPDADEKALYGEAIRFGYESMDRLLGEFLILAEREGAMLMFVTALSQQPFLRYEETGGQNFYRLHDVNAFLRRMGIDYRQVDPTMTHQYMAQFASPELAQSARQRLEALRLESGRAIFGFPGVNDADLDSLYFGCQISTKIPGETSIIDDRRNTPIPFKDLFYKIDAIKSGRHHPDGCLWIQTGRHVRHEAKPSILDILPTQLDLLCVPKPEGAFSGRSLMPTLANGGS